jgi:hypothetical protein
MAFFDENGIFDLDEHILKSPSFRKIMVDKTVTDEELSEQSGRVIALFRKLEETLAPDQLSLVVEAITEAGVFYAVTQHKQLQEFHY